MCACNYVLQVDGAVPSCIDHACINGKASVFMYCVCMYVCACNSVLQVDGAVPSRIDHACINGKASVFMYCVCMYVCVRVIMCCRLMGQCPRA